MARFGTVDILVNNAIATKIAPIAEVDDEGRVINLRPAIEAQGLRARRLHRGQSGDPSRAAMAARARGLTPERAEPGPSQAEPAPIHRAGPQRRARCAATQRLY